MQSSFPSPEH